MNQLKSSKKKQFIFLFFFVIILSGVKAQAPVSVSMNKVRLAFVLTENGAPSYTVSFDEKPVIQPSRLGFVLKDAPAMDGNFEIIKTDTLSFDQTWQPVWGEQKKNPQSLQTTNGEPAGKKRR